MVDWILQKFYLQKHLFENHYVYDWLGFLIFTQTLRTLTKKFLIAWL